MNFRNILFVGIGGGLGAVFRFVIGFFATKFISAQFPYGTLIANFLGCFTIGILMAIFTHKIEHNEMKLFFTTGMMGGLTTFSTFSYESISMLKNHDFTKGYINISVSLLGCLTLTFLGYKLCLNLIDK